MRMSSSLLTVPPLSCFFALPILNAPPPNISKNLVDSYFSEQKLPLRISFVIRSAPLSWNLFRSGFSRQLRAFHVGTSLIALTNLFEILSWVTHSTRLLWIYFLSLA
jgi:hypothetical protein